MTTRLKLGALASGRGSNLQAIFAATQRGDLAAELAVVISNNSGAGALEFANAVGVATRHISAKTDADPAAAMLDALRDVDVLLLAGYMKKLSPAVVRAFEGRALNIHPGPLPRFGGQGMYGLKVHAAVLEAGVNSTGPTVHRVTAEYDEGELLGHTPIEVLPGDTPQALAKRVLAAEHALYWRVIRDHFTQQA